MTEVRPDRPFTRKALIDGEMLVGARWWQESLRLSSEPLSRRRALKGLMLLLGGSAAGLGLFAALSQPADDLDISMDALDLQKREGWNAGQPGTALRFPGATLDPAGPIGGAGAAGMAPGFEPVFIFDNWPHPLGVVASHLTLGSVLYHRPGFLRARSARAVPAPPVFVLDRNRLAHYTDQDTQFANRYVARLPTAENLAALGI